MFVMRMLPPPTDAPRTRTVRPEAPVRWMTAVFGCARSRLTFWNEKTSPCSSAMASASRMRSSSGAKPRMPAISALSVPWPRYVCANDPCRLMSARTAGSPRTLRAMRPRRTAPAVCELDGPIMTGPTMSNTPCICSLFLCFMQIHTDIQKYRNTESLQDLDCIVSGS